MGNIEVSEIKQKIFLKCVHYSIVVCQTEKNAKQAALEDVKRWLRTAADRDGGHSKRKIDVLND